MLHPAQWNSDAQIFELKKPPHISWFDLCDEPETPHQENNWHKTEAEIERDGHVW